MQGTDLASRFSTIYARNYARLVEEIRKTSGTLTGGQLVALLLTAPWPSSTGRTIQILEDLCFAEIVRQVLYRGNFDQIGRPASAKGNFPSFEWQRGRCRATYESGRQKKFQMLSKFSTSQNRHGAIICAWVRGQVPLKMLKFSAFSFCRPGS